MILYKDLGCFFLRCILEPVRGFLEFRMWVSSTEEKFSSELFFAGAFESNVSGPRRRIQALTDPKGPCTQTVYTLGPMYL